MNDHCGQLFGQAIWSVSLGGLVITPVFFFLFLNIESQQEEILILFVLNIETHFCLC
jgi:hypothetical protein